MEEILRAHRDQAYKILQENRQQSREGIELLVRKRLGPIAAVTQEGEALDPEKLEALYREVLDLAYVIFSLGYTFAHTLQKDAASSR